MANWEPQGLEGLGPRRALPPRWVLYVGAASALLLAGALWWSGEAGELWRLFSNRERLQAMVDSAGAWAPAVYVALLAAQAVVAPLPAPAVAVAGGYAFGVVEGFVLTWLGCILGGTVCFALSRLFGRGFVASNARAAKLDAYVSEHGALVVFVLRLIPLVSFDAISYAAGLSGLSFRKFLLATALGMAPGTFVFVYLGGASPGWGMYAALFGLAAAAVAAYLYFRRRLRLRRVR